MNRGNKKYLLLLDGPMGSGKTSVAKIVHAKIKNTAHIGLDQIKWFVSGFKRTPEQNTMTRDVVYAMAKEYLSQGVNVIVEQGTKNDIIDKYKKLAKQRQARFFAYQLEAPKPVLFKRVNERPRRPGRPKLSQARIKRNYRIYLENRHKGIPTINTENLSPAEIAKLILKDIK